MSMNKQILLFISIIVAFVNGTAQRNLTASEAVFISLQNNYQVQIAAKQQSIAETNNTWSEAGLYPTVSLNISQNNTIQDNTNNPFTFTPGIILQQSFTPSISANWNIFSGFAVKISKQRLDQLEQQSANNALTVIETTVQDVLKAYYTAQLQNDRKDLFASVLVLSRKRLQYIQLKEKYSASSSLELLQFQNQYYTDSINFLLQEISYKNAISNLKLYMNEQDSTKSEEQLILTDKLSIVFPELNREQLLNELLENNYNLKSQYISLELQKTNTEFQKSFLYPTLSFQTGINPGFSYLKDIKNDNLQIHTQTISYYGNFNLRYTLFNNFKTKRAIEVSRIQEEISTLSIENMKANLSSVLENLLNLYEARSKMVQLSEQNMEYSKKALTLAENRYELGTINSIDLTAFQNNYQNTMIQHYENLFNRMDTWLEIYKLTGKLGLEYKG